MFNQTLPVYTQKKYILDALVDHQIIIVESPTGSGKTTQIPIILDEAGYSEKGVIGVTQPRRIAAAGVCRFIAEQLQCKIGNYVGYKMRFEDATSSETRLKIITDGTLLQELKSDPWLSQYSILMIDEAHERTLNIDFILGLLKGILSEREDLKVIISSATLNPKVFSQYFDGCPIVSIDTQVFPVDLFYDPPVVESDEEALIHKICEIVQGIILKKDPNMPGDILVFCTGEKMIKDTVSMLSTLPILNQIQILPLYARLLREEQERVFDAAPEGKVKIVVATNVAETSITIDGITTVLDTGLAKMNFYDSRTFTNSLIETPISRASADQRKGRAGRTCKGACYRLYPEQSFEDRPQYTREEIYRTDLTEVILRMAEIGIKDFSSFPFISPPGSNGLRGAVEVLKLMNAIDDSNSLTPVGKQMVPYPLMPRHSRMIVESIIRYPDVLKEVIIAAAFLSAHSPYMLPQGEEMEARAAHHTFRSTEFGDFASYLNIYWDFMDSPNRVDFARRYYLDCRIMEEIAAIVTQLEEITSSNGIPIREGGTTEDFIKSCARGLVPFICFKDGRFSYRSLGSDRIVIHPGSVMFRENPPFIVAGEIMRTTQTYARSVSPLKKEWLAEISPKILKLLHEKPKTDKKQNSHRRSKDTTGKVWIAGEAFEIISKNKGKRKLVLIDWMRLHRALQNVSGSYAMDFGSLRGTLVFNGRPVMDNADLNTVIKTVTLIDPHSAACKESPRGNYYVNKKPARDELISNLSSMMCLTSGKKGSRNNAGFVTLCSDGNGQYWFKSVHNYYRAAQTCMESLENLIDNFPGKKHSAQLSTEYRRIGQFL